MSSKNLDVQYRGLLEGHNGAVTSLVCGQTNDGAPLLISGSRDKSIFIWSLNLQEPVEFEYKVEKDGKETTEKDYRLGKPIKSLHGHNHFVSSLALSSDSKKLLSGSWDKTIRLWDLPTSTTQSLLKKHEKDVLAVAFSNDERLIFSGGMDKSLKYWNIQGECKFETNLGGWISSIIGIQKGKENLMAVGAWDSKVRIINNNYEIARTLEGNDYAVTSMSADANGEFLFVVHKNGAIRIWDLEGSLKKEIETNLDVNAIKFESEYFHTYAIGTSKGVHFRAVKGEQEYFCKEFYKSPACNCLVYDNSKKYLFAGMSDGTIRVFEVSLK